MKKINRDEYINEYIRLGNSVIVEEKLPFASDILDFTNKGKKSERLDHMFEFFDNEEELKSLTSRKNLSFTRDETSEFIDSVIAANISDISESGTIYKQLQACGDAFRIKGNNCGSKGRVVELPITEEDFIYEVRNCYFYFDDPKDLLKFSDYTEFSKAVKGKKEINVRSPLTCRHSKKKGCCSVCAGDIPKGTQNIGAFSTLMITEFATQSALSSMNKGKKENINTLLSSNPAEKISNFEDFKKWVNEMAEDLRGKDVQRRFYEIALLGRMKIDDKDKVTITSLSNPNTDNYFGEFIYRPKEKSFKNMIANAPFFDDSLKGQIAINQFKSGLL